MPIGETRRVNATGRRSPQRTKQPATNWNKRRVTVQKLKARRNSHRNRPCLPPSVAHQERQNPASYQVCRARPHRLRRPQTCRQPYGHRHCRGRPDVGQLRARHAVRPLHCPQAHPPLARRRAWRGSTLQLAPENRARLAAQCHSNRRRKRRHHSGIAKALAVLASHVLGPRNSERYRRKARGSPLRRPTADAHV